MCYLRRCSLIVRKWNWYPYLFLAAVLTYWTSHMCHDVSHIKIVDANGSISSTL